MVAGHRDRRALRHRGPRRRRHRRQYYISVVMLLTGHPAGDLADDRAPRRRRPQGGDRPALQQGLLAGIALLLNPGPGRRATAAEPADWLLTPSAGPALLLYRSFRLQQRGGAAARADGDPARSPCRPVRSPGRSPTARSAHRADRRLSAANVSTTTVHWIVPRLRPRRTWSSTHVPNPTASSTPGGRRAPQSARPAAAARPADGGVDLHRHQLLHPDRHPRRPPRHRTGGRTPRHRQASPAGGSTCCRCRCRFATMVLVGQSAGAQDWRRQASTPHLLVGALLGWNPRLGYRGPACWLVVWLLWSAARAAGGVLVRQPGGW